MKKIAGVLALTVAVLGCQVAGPQIPTQGTLTAINQSASTTVTVTVKDATNTAVWSPTIDPGTSAMIELAPGQYSLTITNPVISPAPSGPILIAAGVDTNWNFFGP